MTTTIRGDVSLEKKCRRCGCLNPGVSFNPYATTLRGLPAECSRCRYAMHGAVAAELLDMLSYNNRIARGLLNILHSLDHWSASYYESFLEALRDAPVPGRRGAVQPAVDQVAATFGRSPFTVMRRLRKCEDILRAYLGGRSLASLRAHLHPPRRRAWSRISKRPIWKRIRAGLRHEKSQRASRAKRMAADPTFKAWAYAHVARYRREHPEKNRFYQQHRRARLLLAEGTYTLLEWETLCAKYGHRCLCCGATLPLTVDHVHPLSQGGRNDIANLQPLCRGCNSRKGARHADFRYATG